MLIDNKTHGKLISELRKVIRPESKISVLSGVFSIYGFYCLKKEISKLSGFRLMISRWDQETINLISGSRDEILLKNKLKQYFLAQKCFIWISKNVEIKAISDKMVFPTQNIFHVDNQNESYAVQGGSHFTASGLGEIKSDSF